MLLEYHRLEQYHQRELIKMEKDHEMDRVKESPPHLASLRGRNLHYLVQSRQVLMLGLTTEHTRLHWDEKQKKTKLMWILHSKDQQQKYHGNRSAWFLQLLLILQAVIKLKRTGEFCITNTGKHIIFVNGKPVETGSKKRLGNQAFIEIANLQFIFRVNPSFQSKLKRQLEKD